MKNLKEYKKQLTLFFSIPEMSKILFSIVKHTKDLFSFLVYFKKQNRPDFKQAGFLITVHQIIILICNTFNSSNNHSFLTD